MSTKNTTALLVIDEQNDFCPGGSLAAPQGHMVVEPTNKLIKYFKGITPIGPIIATRDWHPVKSAHFIAQGGKFPPHCVQGTYGAEFHPKLLSSYFNHIIDKGTMVSDTGAFSGFTYGLDRALKHFGITKVLIVGLVIGRGYCVDSNALDAVKAGYETYVVLDACQPLDPNDIPEAITRLTAAGVKFTTVADVLNGLVV